MIKRLRFSDEPRADHGATHVKAIWVDGLVQFRLLHPGEPCSHASLGQVWKPALRATELLAISSPPRYFAHAPQLSGLQSPLTSHSHYFVLLIPNPSSLAPYPPCALALKHVC